MGSLSSPKAGRLTGRLTCSPDRCKQQQQQRSQTHWGYSPPPEEVNMLNREVWKWIQRLDLSIGVTNPRRDLSNGYFVAELLSSFYPSDVQMHSYQNGTSEPVKRDNWQQVCKVAEKHGLQLPDQLIDGTIKGAPGAAVSLLESLYEQLTNKKVQRLDPKQLPAGGLDATGAAAVAAAAMAAEDPAVSFGEPAGNSDSGALKAIKSSTGTGPTVEFGAVQMQDAGSAAAVRRKFAAQQ